MLRLEPPPPPPAPAGLLRRRYSVPETIMRKYRLAQQRTDDGAASSVASASSACGSCHSLCDPPHRFARRDRELMRKSALLRRMWGRGGQPCCNPRESPSCRSPREGPPCCSPREGPPCCSLREGPPCCSPREGPPCCSPREGLPCCSALRSSDTSSELRPLSAGSSCPRPSPPAALSPTLSPALSPTLSPALSPTLSPALSPAGWATPKRQRLDGDRAENGLDRSPKHSDLITYRSHCREMASSNDNTAETFLKDGAFELERTSDGNTSTQVSEGVSTDVTTAEMKSPAPSPPSAAIAGRNDHHDVSACDRPLAIVTPSYDMLEIAVSESLDAPSASATNLREKSSRRPYRPPVTSGMNRRNVNIDDYVSNILVESLNSLTDQLEWMNASIGSDRKMSIVEKQIKVKLQNTGVNTIVHLSPTSNNQIIFGNEELCHREGVRDPSNYPLSIREEDPSGGPVDNPLLKHDAVNPAVLQQIQQLFRGDYPATAPRPNISHVEVSNVDVFIDEHVDAPLPISARYISGVGTGNYFEHTDAIVVPRFSAFPHSQSMVVNASSAEEAPGSAASSLVDSLEAAPARRRPPGAAADRPQAFFVPIEDDACHWRKDNGNVAEHMPDKIRQKLSRRQRKRELRMEYSKRSRAKQTKREMDKQLLRETCWARRQVERDCVAIVSALIDDVIAKIAQDEYKCVRIRQRSVRGAAEGNESISKKSWGQEMFSSTLPKNIQMEMVTDKDACKVSKKQSVQFSPKDTCRQLRGHEKHQIHGRLSLVTRPSLPRDERGSRRVYQKSEIHEGNKCIEILEILEYVNDSQSSPETTNSDESRNARIKHKKSKIPIPIHERGSRPTSNGLQRLPSGEGRWDEETPSNRELARLLLAALGAGGVGGAGGAGGEGAAGSEGGEGGEPRKDARRASVPPAVPTPPPLQPRGRSNSLRFKRVFDIIPEERASVSVDSSTDDRAPPPDLPPAPRATRSTGTSPPTAAGGRQRSQSTMTSPSSKVAATSPPGAASPPGSGGAGGLRSQDAQVGRRRKSSCKTRVNNWERPASGHRARERAGDACEELPAAPSSPRRRPERRRCSARRGASASSGFSGSSPPSGRSAASLDRGWSVTLAGSGRAPLPADVRMRLRFPPRAPPAPCRACAARPRRDDRLMLTVKKEALDSSIVTSKSRKKSSEPLPELETFQASRSKVKSSVKPRRECSPCWWPAGRAPPASSLSVLGSAIVPELKPRVPTMSERDLTRAYTPRHYLRS